MGALAAEANVRRTRLVDKGAAHSSPSPSATEELFRERRIGIVDTMWYVWFVFGFGLSGLLAFKSLTERITFSPAGALVWYLVVMCIAGLAFGAIGVGVGHLLASALERRDLRLHPRRFESDARGA
jgi:hypothetical protein